MYSGPVSNAACHRPACDGEHFFASGTGSFWCDVRGTILQLVQFRSIEKKADIQLLWLWFVNWRDAVMVVRDASMSHRLMQM